MAKTLVDSTRDNINPIKEYRAFDNFNLDRFYNLKESIASSKSTIREGIDLPLNRYSEKFNHEEYSNRLIREYTPWESYIDQKKKEIDFTKMSSDTRLDTNVKRLNDKEKKKEQSKKGWIAAILGILFLKFGSTLKFLGPLLFKGIAFLSQFKGIVLMLSTMLLSIVAYATHFNISYAIGLVFLIFMHEMGHAIMIVMSGYNVSLPVFIPFFGAAVSMKQMPKDAFIESKIALGGPVLGTLTSIGILGGYFATNDILFLSLAYAGFMLNLFNLTPVIPLDGGKIVSAISTKIWIPALILLLGFTVYFQTPVLILILIFATLNIFSRSKNKDNEYYNVPLHLKLILTIGYFALVSVLAVATYGSFNLLTTHPIP